MIPSSTDRPEQAIIKRCLDGSYEATTDNGWLIKAGSFDKIATLVDTVTRLGKNEREDMA